MRDVLVHARNFAAWGDGVRYAADLAARLDGAVTGAYIHPSPLQGTPSYGSPDLLAAIMDNARQVEQTAHLAQEAFVGWVRNIGVREASWQVAEGRVPEALAHIANWHDVLVLERNPDEYWGAPADLGTLVLGAGIPCLVTPRGASEAPLGCIALAWNGSMESIRAIHAALPLIQHATRVVMLKGDQRENGFQRNRQPPFDIDLYLARHAIEVEHRAIVAPAERAGEALLDAAADVKADLLVMGAYGRTRFSEWMWGGATRKILADASLPVFLRS